jgi:hypothetical protein
LTEPRKSAIIESPLIGIESEFYRLWRRFAHQPIREVGSMGMAVIAVIAWLKQRLSSTKEGGAHAQGLATALAPAE